MKLRFTFCLAAALGLLALPLSAQEAPGNQTVSHGEIVRPATSSEKAHAPMQSEHATKTSHKAHKKNYHRHVRTHQQQKKPGAGPAGAGTSGL
jgi:uncharacterized protein involved in copper resistance